MKLNPNLLASLCVAGLTTGPVLARQAADPKETVTVPAREYRQLLEEHRQMMEEMKALKAFKTKLEQQGAPTAKGQAETDQALDDLEKQVKEVKTLAKESFPGSTKLLLTGYGSTTYQAMDGGGVNGFTATFNPIFLWKINDRLLFEGELEAELGGTDTSIALEMAQISYVLNDYVTIGGGKFLTPMNYFVERQHMAWVNKLPDKPLGVYDSLLPESNIGIQLRGGVPIGSSKISYSVYAANAPQLRLDPAGVEARDLGTLEFDNFDNGDHHVALGGRVGVTILPELEVGYGVQYADVAPSGYGSSIESLLQSADLSYVRDSAKLMGTINFKAQYVWSHVGSYAYFPDGPDSEPSLFHNNRRGGYAQIAYRANHAEQTLLKNLEFVFRYDLLNQKSTLTGTNERRSTIGLNYWVGPVSVVKIAYEFDHQTGPNAAATSGVLVQFATGF